MDFRKELSKYGYNQGNSIDVEILVNEILPSLFSQQERSYSEEEVIDLLKALQIEKLINADRINIENWFEQYKKK
jgi:hypothetical protein